MQNSKRILLVEDEMTHLRVMQSKLEKEGYIVIVATDGEMGLQKIETESPDIILLDILLPKLDGFDVLTKMKERGITTPVIVVSNSGQPVEIDKALALGAKDYLVKAEFNPQDVVEKVASFLKNHTLRDDAQNIRSEAEGSSADFQNKQGPTLLLIEDDKFLRELVTKKLVKEGFTVLEAADGETGLAMLRQNMPQLLLLDLLLPGMDGFEVLKEIKSDKTVSSIPVVVLSNLGQQEDIDMAHNLGAKDFLVKAKFTPAEIVQKVKEILGSSYVT